MTRLEGDTLPVTDWHRYFTPTHTALRYLVPAVSLGTITVAFSVWVDIYRLSTGDTNIIEPALPLVIVIPSTMVKSPDAARKILN